jgi:hydrogenase maturation protease
MAEPPGTLAVIEAEYPPDAGESDGGLDAHSMSPVVVLTHLAHLEGAIERVVVVGCQPETLEEGIGLSAAVAAAIAPAIELVKRVVVDVCERTGMEIPS